MAIKTTRDLVYRAATELGRLYAGDALSAEDYETIEDLVEPLVEQLNALDVVYIDDINAIDPKYFLPLARLLAIEASGSFGSDATAALLERNRAGNVDALREREHDMLRKMTASRPGGEVLKGDFY